MIEVQLPRRGPGQDVVRVKMQQHIIVSETKIAEFCERHHIHKLSLFGSVLRDDFDLSNDVDVLVEFEPGYVPGLITMAGYEIELSPILGRKVDLRTPSELSRYFRQDVLDAAELLYAAG